jgi:uncharacterized protein (TIGR03382 family)
VRSGGCASADGSAWPQLLAAALALLLRPRRKSARQPEAAPRYSCVRRGDELRRARR